MKIATWNINSVRLRLDLVLKFLAEYDIDILCLQETKCENKSFPIEAFGNAGYIHTIYHGEKSYNGVAIISRVALRNKNIKQFCQKQDCRHISSEISLKGQNVILHNFYIPAGGDIPNAELNIKFKHKLDFLAEMLEMDKVTHLPSILVGDLNIALLECDVWSHKQLLSVVSHTPVETEALQKILEKQGWQDLVRYCQPAPQKLYSWWSYRARDWIKSNRGRRLDHIWCSSMLLNKNIKVNIVKEYRSAPQPSDHVPIIAYF